MTTEKNSMSQRRIVVAFSFVALMFFAIGFALGINSFLMPVLENELGTTGAMTYMILAATFTPFLIFSYPASRLIARVGYKRTMATSFLLFALAFMLFIPAANSLNFYIFLAASFVSGTANCVLQAAVNPYVTILGPIGSAAKRLSIAGIVNKLGWAVTPFFLAMVIGKGVGDTQLTDLNLPFMIIVGVFVLLMVLAWFAPLPELKAKGEDESDVEEYEAYNVEGKSTIWHYPHLVLGALALFFYVGVETVALSSLVDYARELGLPNETDYAWISSIGMVVGYLFGVALIPKYLSQKQGLLISTAIALVGSFLVVLLPAQQSIWALFFVAMGCSLVWPAIWPLALEGLGRHTKTGASLLTTAIAGGAVVPPLFGWLKDIVGMQNAYWVAPFCFLFILFYALWGCRLGMEGETQK